MHPFIVISSSTLKLTLILVFFTTGEGLDTGQNFTPENRSAPYLTQSSNVNNSFRYLSANDNSQFWLQKLTRKLSPFMSILSLWNEKCWSATYDQGTCLPMNNCLHKGGSIVGNCAAGFGVCCLFLYSCGTKTERNLTYFSNREFPEVSEGWDTCSHTVTKLDGVCQLRLDFEVFEVSQPDLHGNCVHDSFSVHGGDIRLPLLCGEISGHHLYIPVGYSSEIELTVSIGTAPAWRRWKIKVTKVKCSSLTLAPGGCLQYHKELEGAITSFNYFVDKESNLNHLNYGVCVRRETGYCAIQWHKCGHRKRRRRSVDQSMSPSQQDFSAKGLACAFLWTDSSTYGNVTMEELVRCLRLLGVLGKGVEELTLTAAPTTPSTTPVSIYPFEFEDYSTSFGSLERIGIADESVVGISHEHKLKLKGQPWYSDKQQKIPAIEFKGSVLPSLPFGQRKPKPGYVVSKLPVVQQKPVHGFVDLKPAKLQVKPQPVFVPEKPPFVQPKPKPGYVAPKPPKVQTKPKPGYFAPKPPKVQTKPKPGYFAPKPPKVQTKPKPGYFAPKPPKVQTKPKPGFFAPKPPRVQPKPKPPKIKVKPPRRKPKPKPPKLVSKKPWKKNSTKECEKKKIIPIPIPLPIVPVVAVPFPIGGGGGGGGGGHGHGGHDHDESGEGWGWDGSVVSSVEPYLIRVATDSKKENGLTGFCLMWEQIPCTDWFPDDSHHVYDGWDPTW